MREKNLQLEKTLLELGKITYKLISERAAKIVVNKEDPAETYLSILPHQILQACQPVFASSAAMTQKRNQELLKLLGDAQKVEAEMKESAKNPDMVFLMAGLTPPVDPVALLFKCESFVSAWTSYRESEIGGVHMHGASVLAEIKQVKEVYKVNKKI